MGEQLSIDARWSPYWIAWLHANGRTLVGITDITLSELNEFLGWLRRQWEAWEAETGRTRGAYRRTSAVHAEFGEWLAARHPCPEGER